MAVLNIKSFVKNSKKSILGNFMLQEIKSFKLKYKQAMTNHRYNSPQHQLSR